MSDSANKAVFLSYASQDAEAAKRICAALTRAGVEVWFDQSKLRGGDAWDAKIKKQIRECALFMPVISASTQERAEGYFRLEWKLAVDRSHLVADDTAFLFPLVISDVPDATARVPDKFREVQWTRLQPDKPLDEFAAHVAKLLGQEPEAKAGKAEKTELSAPALAKSAQHRGKPAWTGWLLAAGLVLLGGAAWWAGTPRVPPAPVPAVATDKSIAVLPFTNMSDDKDNAYFADGVHEDILTNLAHIAELKVISRTSVMQYRDSKKPLGQIAAELHAAYVLEGSVRRVGNVVRVTGQLIRAGTDEHVWAQAYDRELKDIFAIQTALAVEIAGALRAAISPAQKNLLTRVPTKVPAAYDLLLRARGILNGSLTWDPDFAEKLRRAESLLRSAVELDPDFAIAWSYLADVHAQIYIDGVDQTAERLALARAALDKAVHLAPDDPDVIRNSGAFYYHALRDYGQAEGHYRRLLALQPNDSEVHTLMGLLLRRQGKWKEALGELRRGYELDPGNLQHQISLLATLLSGARRYDEAEALATSLAGQENDPLGEFTLDQLYIPFYARGSTEELREHLAAIPAGLSSQPAYVNAQWDFANNRGDWEETVRLSKVPPRGGSDYMEAAACLMALGRQEEAQQILAGHPEELRGKLQLQPGNISLLEDLARVEALLGHAAEARAAMQRAFTSLPSAGDAVDEAELRLLHAVVLGWTGDKEGALQELAWSLQHPLGRNVHFLGKVSWFAPLHGDPRFEALLNDPKNNAPLF